MIGVVVWSSSDREKAVIWCEDQGALAYLNGLENMVANCIWPSAGDLVELDSEMQGDLRYARRVGLVAAQHFPELPAILKQEATMQVTDTGPVLTEEQTTGQSLFGNRWSQKPSLAICSG